MLLPIASPRALRSLFTTSSHSCIAHRRLRAPNRGTKLAPRVASPRADAQPQPPPQRLALAALAALAATGIVVTARLGPEGTASAAAALQDALASQGPLAGPALFIAAYVLATVLLLPGSVLTLAAGALYGPLEGTALVSLASTAGATAAFVLARSLARPWVEQSLLQRSEGASNAAALLQRLDRGIASQGPRLILLLRLSPLVPFSLSNYLYGLTAVPLLPYIGASWLGMLPGTFAYVYLGSAARAAVEAAGEGGAGAQTVLFVVGAVATLAATKLLADAVSGALEEGGEST